MEDRRFCDGHTDCPDGSDEGVGCLLGGCEQNNGGCSQVCNDIPEGLYMLEFCFNLQSKREDKFIVRPCGLFVIQMLNITKAGGGRKQFMLTWKSLYNTMRIPQGFGRTRDHDHLFMGTRDVLGMNISLLLKGTLKELFIYFKATRDILRINLRERDISSIKGNFDRTF